MSRDDYFEPPRPSLLEIHSHRLCPEGSHPISSLPPSSGRMPLDLLRHTYPCIVTSEDSTSEILQLSETESIPIDPNDDGGHDTRLTYPHNILLQLARIKKRQETNPVRELSTIDMTDLLRIASSFTHR